MATLRLGILISGRGSNLQAILNAIKAKELDASVELVLSNKPDAKGLDIARDYGVSCEAVIPSDFKSKADYEAKLVSLLNKHKVGLVVLAGYMRIVSDTLLNTYPQRIINIHPSLLPAFKGLDAQQQAIDYGAKISGCTAHLVDEQTDHGPIILQSSVAVLDTDTAESLSSRILIEEHKLLPMAIQLFAENRVHIVGRRVLQ